MKRFLFTFAVAASTAVSAMAGTIVKSTDGPFGSTRFTLSNGLNVYLRPGNKDCKKVEITAYAPKGFATNYNPARQSTYRAAGDVLAVSKIGGVPGAQLRRELKARGIKAGIEIDNYASEISVEAPDSALARALNLVEVYATDIKADSLAVSRWVGGKLRMFDSPKRNAVVAMGDSIHATVYRRHPLGAKLSRLDVERLDYNDVLDLHKELFGDMTDFTVIITGPQNTDETRKLIAATLGDLPASGKHSKNVNVDYGYHRGNTKLEYTFPAENTPETIVYTFRNAKAPFTLSNLLTSRSLGVIYRRRLLKELEDVLKSEKSITSHCAVVDGINGSFGGAQMIIPCYIKCTHGSEDQVAKTVDSVLADLAANGPTTEEVDAERARLTREYKSLTNDIGYWQTVIRKYLTTGVDVDSKYLATVKAMTPESFKKFTKNYVAPSAPLRMIMRPEK